jgi:hypothetical protein
MKSVFTDIFNRGLWASAESRSGTGSELSSTEVIRAEIPAVISKYNVKSVLDIPCGDMNWMTHTNLMGARYIGADIVPALIEQNREKWPDKEFLHLDLAFSALPKVDMVLVRDCFGHLSTKNVHRCIQNIRVSGIRYMLATSLTRTTINTDIADGGWRCINLMVEPYNLRPLYLINEEHVQIGHDDKCLVLFDMLR